MTDWIPFYASLTHGRKRALPRASRFIFLELCLRAREGDGAIELSPGMDNIESVHDLLGGNRREVAQAVGLLHAEGMIDFQSQAGYLLIKSWETWRLTDRTNATRQARWRARKSNAGDRYDGVTSNGAGNEANRYDNVSRSDKKREEEKRTPRQDIPAARATPTAPAASEPDQTSAALTPDERALLERAHTAGQARLANELDRAKVSRASTRASRPTTSLSDLISKTKETESD